uniref:Uncharacterized protein n=1 Tax=Glossina pallidipes TaxID=7398 RepID=A0A1A9ZIH7_GLOPL
MKTQLFDILNGCKVAPLHKNLDYLEEFKALAGKFSNCVKKIFENPMDFKPNQIIVQYMF